MPNTCQMSTILTSIKSFPENKKENMMHIANAPPHAGATTLILSKRWVTLIVIIIMQPCLWNADYAIMQQSSIKNDNISLKKVVDH